LVGLQFWRLRITRDVLQDLTKVDERDFFKTAMRRLTKTRPLAVAPQPNTTFPSVREYTGCGL
jgi:hypothetical protein